MRSLPLSPLVSGGADRDLGLVLGVRNSGVVAMVKASVTPCIVTDIATIDADVRLAVGKNKFV